MAERGTCWPHRDTHTATKAPITFSPPSGGLSSRLKKVLTLSNSRREASLTTLIAALGDESSAVRHTAVIALSQQGDLEVVRLLTIYLKTNPSDIARTRVLEVLEKITSLKEDETVRKAAQKAIHCMNQEN